MSAILTLGDGKMHWKQDRMFVTKKSNFKNLTAHGGWIRRWHHWNHHEPRENDTAEKADMRWVRFREEVTYQRRVWEYLSAHFNENLPSDSLYLVVLDGQIEWH